MEKRKKTTYRIVLRRSHPVIWVCVLALVAVSALALITLQASIAASNAEYAAMQQQAAQMEEGNEALEERIDALGSLESAIQIAMEKLGLVFPDSIFFDPND